ncbi:MAG: hypothetical protein QOJ54_2461 [Aliidongia sp.]|jgi:hypothetical protein|nr:hypothetical protein [Aliidongia sp.]
MAHRHGDVIGDEGGFASGRPTGYGPPQFVFYRLEALLADIFNEIDEDLRRDRLEKLWQRYRGWVIAAAIGVVLATAAGVAWRDYQQAQYAAAAQRYNAAEALARTDSTKAVAAFDTMAADSGSSYAVLARLQAAALKARDTDKAGGIAALKAIAADSAVEEPYRSLAAILAAQYGIDDEPAADIIARLQPLRASTEAWRFDALELTALAQYKSGDKPAALNSYKQLADDLAAPQTMRARATEIIAALSH